MLVTYSAGDGLGSAILKTFDGKHPCKLCKLVSEGRKAEKKDAKQTSLKKIDSILVKAPAIHFEAEPFLAHAPFRAVALARSQSPPCPPPDFA